MDAVHDVVVVGAGLAGMRAAIEAFDAGADVAMVSKIHPVRSHSGAAEGGINAALGNASEDDPEKHAFDTVKGSDYLGDQDAIEILCQEAPDDVYQLEHWGAVFSRTPDGRIAQRPFGAAGEPRTAYAADITGHVLIHVLYEQVMKRDIKTYEEFFAWKLVVDDDRCQGVIAWDLLNGGLSSIGAKTVILATGGAGRLYTGTTNAYACTGDGMAMALRAGVALKDMEMMQFHPTTLAPTGVLITEGCRGEGAYLLNKDGERFLVRYAPNAMELASRDVISRAEQTEIDQGRGIDGNVLLDLRHLGAERIVERLHGTRELSMTFAGVDPIYEPIPVRPGAHYHMGGVDTDVWGQTALDGLYAAGEVACVSVHGANRLGGNALMETITYGKRVGRHASEWALTHTTVDVPASVETDAERELGQLLDRSEGERPWQIRDELAESMHVNFGVFRREDQMLEEGDIVRGLRERYERIVVEDKGSVFNSDLTQALELGYLLDLAECMVVSGLARRESRGAHARPHDFPIRDDENFLRHTVVTWEDGAAKLDWKPVTMTKWQPEEKDDAVKMALKIWRYDPTAGERALKEYEVDAPDWVTLLDLLDIVKDKHDGTLAYRKSCRMMICGSCGMRMDGAAVLACKTRMYDIAASGHVPVISAMGNMPIVKDLVVDMEPFWGKIRAVQPWLDPGYSDPGDKEYVVSQPEMDVIHKESLCIMCGCCVSECNSMEADPEFLGPAALAKGMRFVGDARDRATVERLQSYSEEHGIWDCTRCYFCQERCPKGVDPRDAIAKLGAEAVKEGIDSDMGAKHAKWFVTSAKTTGWLRETELVPKTQGVARSLKEVKFAMGLFRHGKVPPPIPPHVAKHVDESRALYDLLSEQGRAGADGIVQAEKALAHLALETDEERDPYGEGSFPKPLPLEKDAAE